MKTTYSSWVLHLTLSALFTGCSLIPSVEGQINTGACDLTCPPVANGMVIESLCPGDTVETTVSKKVYDVCHPAPNLAPSTIILDSFRASGHVTVIANYFTGCVAGRRESGVFAHIAQRVHDENPKVNFIVSLKGGGACTRWASKYQNDASAYSSSGDIPTTMPLTVSDDSYEIRDYFFTHPYPHPSYIVLDENMEVAAKFVGPCCGKIDYYDCSATEASALDGQLTAKIDELLTSYESVEVPKETTTPPTSKPSGPAPAPSTPVSDTPVCEVGNFSAWSPCSVTCGEGIQFRWRAVDIRSDGVSSILKSSSAQLCESPVEKQVCTGTDPTCEEQCIPEFGETFEIDVVSSGFVSPRDVAFHPTPGMHLKDLSEGRKFHPDEGEEAWVLNGGNHSVSIVASLGSSHQTTFSRRDRGYYHYMINATALAFNSVSSSNRAPDQDSFNYWAVCNDNRNNYLGSKEDNFFMGPTLYNSKPNGGNIVNRLGETCNPAEPCHFLHSDMLHEAPACIGIAHDTELKTAYGTVYWAFDATGDLQNGQLVRFDFQQPHGPGSMDHSVAAVRRYPEVKLHRGPPGGHAGMVVHADRRELFVVSPGDGTVLVIDADSGSFSRTAREEYPIFSNRLPSFEYSIYECTQQHVFASGLENPTGLALSSDGDRLFVGELGGKILVYEVSSGALLKTVESQFSSIGGMSFSLVSNQLHFVDSNSNVLAAVKPSTACDTTPGSRLSPDFVDFMLDARSNLDSQHGDGFFSLYRDYECEVDGAIPNGTLFEQVHTDSGYASDNPDVQSQAGMDESAALLANRTDCGIDSDLNFDALLLGGYYCHHCLPQNEGSSCDSGGACSNVQWLGFTCDNEYFVTFDDEFKELVVMNAVGERYESNLHLKRGVTYRFTVNTGSFYPVTLYEDSNLSRISNNVPGNPSASATTGPLIIYPDESTPDVLFLSSSAASVIQLKVIDEFIEPENNEKDDKEDVESNGETQDNTPKDTTVVDNDVIIQNNTLQNTTVVDNTVETQDSTSKDTTVVDNDVTIQNNTLQNTTVVDNDSGSKTQSQVTDDEDMGFDFIEPNNGSDNCLNHFAFLLTATLFSILIFFA